MVNFLQVFLIAVSSAVILNVFLKRFELPTIIGYILTGIILSQIYRFNVNDGFLHIAEFGIVYSICNGDFRTC